MQIIQFSGIMQIEATIVKKKFKKIKKNQRTMLFMRHSAPFSCSIGNHLDPKYLTHLTCINAM